jgi:hypothetical protein
MIIREEFDIIARIEEVTDFPSMGKVGKFAQLMWCLRRLNGERD